MPMSYTRSHKWKRQSGIKVQTRFGKKKESQDLLDKTGYLADDDVDSRESSDNDSDEYHNVDLLNEYRDIHMNDYHPIHEGWVMYTHESGHKYYHNEITRESIWVHDLEKLNHSPLMLVGKNQQSIDLNRNDVETGASSLCKQNQAYFDECIQLTSGQATFEREIKAAQTEIDKRIFEQEIAHTKNVLSLIKDVIFPSWLTNHLTRYWNKEENHNRPSSIQIPYDIERKEFDYDGDKNLRSEQDIQEKQNKSQSTTTSNLKQAAYILKKIHEYSVTLIRNKLNCSIE